MAQPSSHETISILRKLDLGQHTLFMMSDGGMGLLANDESSCLTDNGMSLDRDETYRLFVSLHEQFQRSAFSEEPLASVLRTY